MSKTIRDVYGEALAKYGAENKNVVVLDADVSGSTKSGLFGKACPERFFNCGIAEYAMIGMAAGMARNGKIPFVNAFAVFETTIGLLAARTFMSYSGLPVKMMGAYGGLSDAYDGATHQSLEDIAVMRTLPGVIVMVASDAQITEWMVKKAIETEKPMYIRLSRDAAMDCHPEDAKFELGKGMILRKGTDLTIIACGLMVGKALEASEKLEKKGIHARVVDMYTIKPIDTDLIESCAKETKAILTVEEHSVIGGLGGAVAEVLAKAGSGVPLKMLGMNDCHGESGAYHALLSKYGLDSEAIIMEAERLLEK